MLNFDHCEIKDIIIHRIGNKFEGEQLVFSRNSYTPEDQDISTVLKNYFLSPFKREAYYHFSTYADELDNNPVYNAVCNMFSGNSDFYALSVGIAEHLYEQSNRPEIKSGELYVVIFSNCTMDDGVCDAIGIFKSETKETFLRVLQDQDIFQLHSESGINIKKLDKACLIFNTGQEEGYKALISDKSSAKESIYWVNDFLGIHPSDEDSYFQTANYLNLCKDFVRDIYNNENDIPKADQIDMLNRSFNFFKETDRFSESDFMNNVVQKPEMIDAFENFRQNYEQIHQVPVASSFNVSDCALKDEKKYFKHVLKLDKNFHVYIHGQRKYIEKGYDTARDMNYYKLFFRDEE